MNRALNSAARQQGFTLIEVLIVVLIMGLATSFVVMSVSGNSHKEQVKRAALKMAALSNIALDQAVLSGRDYGVVFARDKYHFVELVEQRWQPAQDELLQEQELQDIFIEAEVEGFRWLPDQEDFSSSALFTEREVDQEQDEKEKPHIPQLLILSSGEMTPFRLTFAVDPEKVFNLETSDAEYFAVVKANTLGLLTVLDSNDEESYE
ncbi:MAG: type II secretion system minor pseudopilin GspH [Psychrobium sp.]